VSTHTFSSLFTKAQQGDLKAREAVYKMAFIRLRGIASSLLRRERHGHTLQPTALVSELFLKLHRIEARVMDEDHFFRIAARAMRQVLIDHARNRGSALKVSPESVPELLVATEKTDTSPESLLSVRAVFQRLRTLDKKVAETLWLRSVEGLTLREVSTYQQREIWRVRADYDFGVRWMADRISREARSSESANP
jgi:RNA polymerase sigma-70 factor, ECF subfamily